MLEDAEPDAEKSRMLRRTCLLPNQTSNAMPAHLSQPDLTVAPDRPND